MSSYPTGYDSFTNPAGSDPLSGGHADQHADINDAVEAVQAELGLSPSGSEATVTARLAALDTTVGGKVTKPGGGSDGDVLTKSGSSVIWSAGGGGGGGGGLAFIGSEVFTTQSAVHLDGLFSSAYDDYMVIARLTGSTAQNIDIRMRNSGTDDTSANYSRESVYFDNTTTGAFRESTQTVFRSGYNDAGFLLRMDVYGPYLSLPTWFDAHAIRHITTPVSMRNAGSHNVSSSFDSMSVIPDSGTISGTITVFGYPLT
jgi:hypothetical protein